MRVGCFNSSWRKSHRGSGVRWTRDQSRSCDTRVTEGTVPHQEHDFGSFTLHGHGFVWKTDYYDQACQFGSENFAYPSMMTRILNIVFASE